METRYMAYVNISVLVSLRVDSYQEEPMQVLWQGGGGGITYHKV